MTRSSSSETLTQVCLERKLIFSCTMRYFCELSWGCSRALNTVAPMIRYRTTSRKITTTVFHFITVVMVSQSSPELYTMGLEENDSRGLVLCVADLGSKRSGAATGANKGRERARQSEKRERERKRWVIKDSCNFKEMTADEALVILCISI